MTRNDIRALAKANGWHAVKTSTLDSYDRAGVVVSTHWTSKGVFTRGTRHGDTLSGIGEAFSPTRERTVQLSDVAEWLA